MKKTISFALCVLAMLAMLTGCGTPYDRGDVSFTPTDAPTNAPTTTVPTTEDPGTTYTFDVGFSVTMNATLAEQESQMNDFYALGNDGEFAIICNLEPLADYESLDEYAKLAAESNNATAEKAADGNYFFSYINDEQGYHFYTAVRQGAENFYRVAFYCPLDNWSFYGDDFAQWAETVTVQ